MEKDEIKDKISGNMSLRVDYLCKVEIGQEVK